MKWKRETMGEEGNAYVSGDFRVEANGGTWILSHRGEELSTHKQKGEGQAAAEEFAKLYKGGGKKPVGYQSLYIMFDVKGEYGVVGARLEALVSACMTTMRLVGVRVVEQGGRQVVDGEDDGTLALIRAAAGAATLGPGRGKRLTTVELYRHPGTWVLCLLPAVEAEENGDV